jgi:hypothetical protein
VISFISKKTLFEYYLNKLQLMLVVRQHDVTESDRTGSGSGSWPANASEPLFGP